MGAAFSLSQAAGDKQQEFAAHMQKADGYLREKQPALAIPELQAAVALNPESVDAQANLGVLLFFQAKAADAIPHFRAALKVQPGLAKIHGLLGMAESRTLDFDNARRDMEAAFPSLEDRSWVWS
jgi:Tfp pilus assembly protein PilF